MATKQPTNRDIVLNTLIFSSEPLKAYQIFNEVEPMIPNFTKKKLSDTLKALRKQGKVTLEEGLYTPTSRTPSYVATESEVTVDKLLGKNVVDNVAVEVKKPVKSVTKAVPKAPTKATTETLVTSEERAVKAAAELVKALIEIVKQSS